MEKSELTLNTTEKKLLYGIYERLGEVMALLQPKTINKQEMSKPNLVNNKSVKEIAKIDNKNKVKKATANNS